LSPIVRKIVVADNELAAGYFGERLCLDRLCLVALLSTLDKRSRHPVPRHRAEARPIVDPQDTGGVAEPRRLFQYRLEHWRQVAGRGVDSPQDLGGRGLARQRLVALGRRLIQVPLSFVQLGLAVEEGAETASKSTFLFSETARKSMTACIRLLDQMPRSTEMELNQIGQCTISGNSGPREPCANVRCQEQFDTYSEFYRDTACAPLHVAAPAAIAAPVMHISVAVRRIGRGRCLSLALWPLDATEERQSDEHCGEPSMQVH
jgi:hypothetical protein